MQPRKEHVSFDGLDEFITDEGYLAEQIFNVDETDCIESGCQNALTSKKKPKASLDLKHFKIG